MRDTTRRKACRHVAIAIVVRKPFMGAVVYAHGTIIEVRVSRLPPGRRRLDWAMNRLCTFMADYAATKIVIEPRMPLLRRLRASRLRLRLRSLPPRSTFPTHRALVAHLVRSEPRLARLINYWHQRRGPSVSRRNLPAFLAIALSTAESPSPCSFTFPLLLTCPNNPSRLASRRPSGSSIS